MPGVKVPSHDVACQCEKCSPNSKSSYSITNVVKPQQPQRNMQNHAGGSSADCTDAPRMRTPFSHLTTDAPLNRNG